MKRYLLLFVCLVLFLAGFAQEKDKVAWRLKLDQVDVTAQRRFQDIGTTRTEIDTMVLRENVVNSLADILSQSTSVFIKNYGRGHWQLLLFGERLRHIHRCYGTE